MFTLQLYRLFTEFLKKTAQSRMFNLIFPRYKFIHLKLVIFKCNLLQYIVNVNQHQGLKIINNYIIEIFYSDLAKIEEEITVVSPPQPENTRFLYINLFI